MSENKQEQNYPTGSQLKETWDAVEARDHKALVEILRKRREAVEKAPTNPPKKD